MVIAMQSKKSRCWGLRAERVGRGTVGGNETHGDRGERWAEPFRGRTLSRPSRPVPLSDAGVHSL